MVNPSWVSELLAKEDSDDKVYNILKMLFILLGYDNIPSAKDQFWGFITSKLKEREDTLSISFVNLINCPEEFLLDLEKYVDMKTDRKIKLQKFLEGKTEIINPTNFDGVDGLCGVIAFLMKEISEYLGIVPLESAKKTSIKEKIYLFNSEKIEFFNQQENQLINFSKKHNINME